MLVELQCVYSNNVIRILRVFVKSPDESVRIMFGQHVK